eukprot:CAMPEP_0194160704 /NCGR_PEP_ID=MMETSP0152-20130528/78535_1 /TAXON_ID=1049557 /ORGANISM="Thalassiothrix antarctica, Strain L6-D1" /LENGTH=539 /DNA_ID=CAMNT_0038870413 /DNA_START=717 /DNA_END=2332 /DNA_ORIENTATION=-
MKKGITENYRQRQGSSNDNNIRANNQDHEERDEENDASLCNQQRVVVTPTEIEYHKALFGVANGISPSKLTFDPDTGTPQPERFFHFGRSQNKNKLCHKEEEKEQHNKNNQNNNISSYQSSNILLPPAIQHTLSETDIIQKGKHLFETNRRSSNDNKNKKRATKTSWKHNDIFSVTLPVIQHLGAKLYDLSLGRDGSYLSMSGGTRILYDYTDPKFGGNPFYAVLKQAQQQQQQQSNSNDPSINNNDWITCLEYCNQIDDEELVCFGTIKGDVRLIQQWVGGEEGSSSGSRVDDNRTIWNLQRVHTGCVTSLCFSRQPETKFVLSGGQDTNILCHNYVTGKTVARLVSHRSEIRSMTLNADESLLASCDSMGQILIWDALSIFSAAAAIENDEHYPNSSEQQQQCPTRCFSPQQGLYQESLTRSVLWNPFDATILMSGSMRGYLTMWDVESGTIMRSIDTESSILSMAWSREANELITANNCYASGIGTINIWNPKTLNWKLECDCERMPILSLSLSDDGSTLGCIFDGGCQGTGTTMT